MRDNAGHCARRAACLSAGRCYSFPTCPLMTLRIGISARLLHRPPPGLGLPLKRLQYLESTMAHWIMSHGVVALMIPFIDHAMPSQRKRPPIQDLVRHLDGLVLQGGVDIDPATYRAAPWQAGMDTDPIRDDYELELLRGFIEAGKPVLGICRGAQLLNVYHGGTLLQDIPSQWVNGMANGAINGTAAPATPATHWDEARYDHLTHDVRFLPGSLLDSLYGPGPHPVVSIHHQCVGELGKGLVIEARCPQDGVPEAIRHPGHPFVVGVQWHPEFHLPGPGAEPLVAMDSGPLMMAFLKAALRRAGRLRRLAHGVSQVRERARAAAPAPNAAAARGAPQA